jgi:glycerophosphoryl diester phosphodiesterase
LILVAHRGVAQQFDRTGLGRDDCTAARIVQPEHNYIENTIRSINDARAYGADMVELDVQPTADGQMVVFHDRTLDCRTNGHGPVRERKLAELKALDVGYGYTADGGKTFPLRGRGVGLMPTVEEVLKGAPRTKLLFNFKSRDPREADLLAAAFRRAGVAPDARYGFYGDERVVARMRRLAPKAWTWSRESAEACGQDYLKWGWTSFVPASCRNGTIVVPLNHQWTIWGWPNRFLARMAGSNTKVIVMGPLADARAPAGLDQPEQLGEVPRSFKGYLWVEDIYTVGRALRN